MRLCIDVCNYACLLVEIIICIHKNAGGWLTGKKQKQKKKNDKCDSHGETQYERLHEHDEGCELLCTRFEQIKNI